MPNWFVNFERHHTNVIYKNIHITRYSHCAYFVNHFEKSISDYQQLNIHQNHVVHSCTLVSLIGLRLLKTSALVAENFTAEIRMHEGICLFTVADIFDLRVINPNVALTDYNARYSTGKWIETWHTLLHDIYFIKAMHAWPVVIDFR